MDIDLLFSDDGQAGLITARNFIKKIAGVTFETSTSTMALEYIDQDEALLNIPVENTFIENLDLCAQIHIGAIQNGQISQAYQVPLLFLDDPYRAEMITASARSIQPLGEFANFMTKCAFGQPINRNDLGNEEASGCILDENSRSSLDFAPHLIRRHSMENAPRAIPVNVPNFSIPGLGNSGSGGGSTHFQSNVRRDSGKKDEKK